ncbi:MAG: tetratricopeptide repeat protein [Bacteroidota bacterium]
MRHPSPSPFLPVLLVLLGAATGCATTFAPGPSYSIAVPVQVAPPPAAADTVNAAEAQRLFIRGLTRALTGDSERAASLYLEALELVPDQPAVLAALGEAYEQMDDARAAQFYLARAIDVDPETPSYRVSLARLQMNTGQLEDAADTFRALFAQQPADLETGLGLADVLAALNAQDEALAVYAQLIERAGDDLFVREQMLQLYDQLDDLDGQLETLEAMRLLEPANADILRALADAYMDAGATLQAAETLETVVNQHPADTDALLTLADLYRDLGKPAQADALLAGLDDTQLTPAEQLDRALARVERAPDDSAAVRVADELLANVLSGNPDAPSALFMLGRLRLLEGRFEEAGDALTRALAQDPRRQDAWAQAADAYLQAGLDARAFDVAEEGTMLFPGQLPLLRLAAYAALNAGRPRDAVLYTQDALDVLADTEAPDALGTRTELLTVQGFAHQTLGNWPDAERAFQSALDAAPDDPVALDAYAFGLAEQNERLDEALRMAARAVESDPVNPLFLDTLGWVYFQMGRPDLAVKHLQQAVDAGALDPETFERLERAKADL